MGLLGSVMSVCMFVPPLLLWTLRSRVRRDGATKKCSYASDPLTAVEPLSKAQTGCGLLESVRTFLPSRLL